MKHPVDTSQWGDFVVGELFDCDTTKTFYPNKSELPPGNTPYITRSTYDNGISGYYDDINNEFTIEGNCLTIGAEGGIAFWQPKPFIAGVKVYTIRHPQLNELTALFVASLLNAHSANYSYTNARVLAKIKAESIKLPLKPSANPSDYTQDDIDWDYMDTVMSRVTEKAKDRLANLPQPTDKKKTPVDTSNWGDFVVGELFDKCDLKRIKPDFNKHADLSSTPSDEFNLPLINAKVGNNGIMYYGRSSDWESETMTLDIVNDGAASTGMVYAQPQATGTLYNAYQIKLKPNVHENLTVSQLLFLATTTQASIQNKFSYENKAIWNKVQKESIKLPLKPSANPSNYTQNDIDWDYMERFMQAIEEKAHERVASLKKQI